MDDLKLLLKEYNITRTKEAFHFDQNKLEDFIDHLQMLMYQSGNKDGKESSKSKIDEQKDIIKVLSDYINNSLWNAQESLTEIEKLNNLKEKLLLSLVDYGIEQTKDIKEALKEINK